MNRALTLPSPSGRGQGEGAHTRSHEILFIDARNLGHLINRRTKELSNEDIQQIADTYHAWLNSSVIPAQAGKQSEAEFRGTAIQPYQDIKGFCASVPLSRVEELDYVLTPGRYVGLPDEEDDFNFAERFAALKAEFEAQLLEETKLNKAIAENLAKVKV
jgi:type I restriction enzyme M protein